VNKEAKNHISAACHKQNKLNSFHRCLLKAFHKTNRQAVREREKEEDKDSER
jgi:hypothetical protein